MDQSSSHEKVRLALHVSEGYYLNDESQKQLARKLDISTATVSRLLQFARQEGIVQIRVCPPKDTLLGNQLQQVLGAWGVREVIVTPLGRATVGHAAARFFERQSKDGDMVVLDGGLSVRDFVSAIEPSTRRQLTIGHIATDPPSYEVSSYENMTHLAASCPQSTCVKLPYSKNRRLDSLFEHAHQRMLDANFVFLGVGPVLPKFTGGELLVHFGLETGSLHEENPDVQGISGYITFDSSGNEIVMPLLDKVMRRALNMLELRELSRASSRWVCMLASSETKVEPTLAALRGRMCNCLILDNELATELLRRLEDTADD